VSLEKQSVCGYCERAYCLDWWKSASRCLVRNMSIDEARKA